jgi:hypothetical protein
VRPGASSYQCIYDGRDLVGVIRRVGKKFEARDSKRKLIGRYETAKRATAAINQSCVVERVTPNKSPGPECRSRG